MDQNAVHAPRAEVAARLLEGHGDALEPRRQGEDREGERDRSTCAMMSVIGPNGIPT